MEIRTTERDLFGSVESLLESIQREPVDSDVAVILLKIHNPALQTDTKSYNLSLFGKKLIEWVKLAFDQCPITEVECDMSADIISTIRPHLQDKKWTAVFYADTPLLQRRTFLNILDWVQTKRMNVCKLDRGWVFVTDYIKQAERIFATTEQRDFGKEDFLTVFNMQQLENAGQVLHQRILNYHQQNGVQFLDKNTTFVDADVTIGKNVVIYPNNFITGSTVIRDNVQIGPFCTIKSSKIGKDIKLNSVYIENSEIADNASVLPYTTITNGTKKRTQ